MKKKELLRMKDLTELLKISRGTIYKWIKNNEFPQPIKIGRGIAWFQDDICNWLKTRKRGIEERKKEQ